MKLSLLICFVHCSYAALYTPRMFRPGGKYYTAPKYGPGSGGIDDATRQELSGILNGILSNLQHHKAALPQVAHDIVTQYHLTSKDAKDILDMYTGLSNENLFNSADRDVQ